MEFAVSRHREEKKAWKRELADFARAISGAFLFGIPLLYTMEMWWLGKNSETGHLLVILAVTLVANIGLSYVAGFRRPRSKSETIEEALDSVAVGIVCSIIVLFTLNEVSFSDPLNTVLGLVVIQTLPLSLGASIAGAVFRRDASREGDAKPRGLLQSLATNIGATSIGAAFVASTIAPTEEVTELAMQMDFLHLLMLIALSLFVGYIIVFASGFDETAKVENQSSLDHPLTETTLAYLVSLIVAFACLYLTKQIGSEYTFASIVGETLVLGLPATVGGAAGRIVA